MGLHASLRLAREAWGSQSAIKFWPLAISTPIAILSVPLVEVENTDNEQLGWLAASAIAQLPALLVLYLGWLLFYRKSKQHWTLLLLISSLSGFTKGLVTHASSIWLGLDITDTPSLGARLLTAILTWSVSIAGFAILNYKVLAPRQLWQELHFELQQSDRKLVDAEQQLHWLIQKRLSGLSDSLAKDLASLIDRARKLRTGEEDSYKEVSDLLRSYAKSELRSASRELWQKQPKNSPLVAATLRSITNNPLNPVSTAVILGFGYLLNEFRLSGFSLALLGAVILIIVSYLSVLALKYLAKAKPKTRAWGPWLYSLMSAASMFLVISSLPVPRSEQYIITTTALGAMWGFASIFVSGWIQIADDLFNAELENLSKRSGAASERLTWLQMRVEAVNRELAKYLHGVVQSRLMAYAMQIENHAKSGNKAGLQTSLDELSEVFLKPLSAFQSQSMDLKGELAKIAAGWMGVLKISFDLSQVTPNPSATLGTTQLVTEGVANSFKHGRATEVFVKVQDSGRNRLVEITDNGVALGTANPGLGMTIISSITQNRFVLTREAGSTVLRCQLDLSSESQDFD